MDFLSAANLACVLRSRVPTPPLLRVRGFTLSPRRLVVILFSKLTLDLLRFGGAAVPPRGRPAHGVGLRAGGQEPVVPREHVQEAALHERGSHPPRRGTPPSTKGEAALHERRKCVKTRVLPPPRRGRPVLHEGGKGSARKQLFPLRIADRGSQRRTTRGRTAPTSGTVQ